MKLLLFLISYLIFQAVFGQEKQLIFQNFGTPTALGLYSQKVHMVLLNPDKTFEFWSRPHVSCLTWHDYKGTWAKRGDTLFFSDKYEIDEKDTRVTYQNDARQSFFISFKTDKNSPLTNKVVKVKYEYDFVENLAEPEVLFELKPDGSIEIPYKDVPYFRQLSAIRIEYKLDTAQTRYEYLTQNNPLNKKKSDVPNIIHVEFVEHPKSETVYRTIKGVIKKDRLIIFSVTKTKTTLPDYNRDLEFENNFILQK